MRLEALKPPDIVNSLSSLHASPRTVPPTVPTWWHSHEGHCLAHSRALPQLGEHNALRGSKTSMFVLNRLKSSGVNSRLGRGRHSKLSSYRLLVDLVGYDVDLIRLMTCQVQCRRFDPATGKYTRLFRVWMAF
mgnify:CR=1 FL=1